MLRKKGLIHLYYGEPPNVKYIFDYYGKEFITKKDKLTLFVDRDGYPFYFEGVIYNLCKIYDIVANLYIQNMASSLISCTYDKELTSNKIFPLCNNTKINPNLISYQYYVEIWNNKFFIKINDNGVQRDIISWIKISKNVLDYNVLTRLISTIPLSVYSDGPCSTCLVVSTCLNKDIYKRYKVSKPCKELNEYCKCERKKLMRAIPDDIKEFILSENKNSCWE